MVGFVFYLPNIPMDDDLMNFCLNLNPQGTQTADHRFGIVAVEGVFQMNRPFVIAAMMRARLV